MGFRTRLIFSYLAIILISFIATAYFLDKKLEKNSLCEIESSLISQAYLIESQVPVENLKKEDIPSLMALFAKLSSRTKCRITLINKQGKVLADSGKKQEEIPGMENHLNRPEIKAALSGSIGVDTHYSRTLKMDMLYVALPVHDAKETIGVLRLALSLENVQKMLSGIRRIILLGLVFSLVSASILGSFLAGAMSNSIKRIIQVSRKYAEGDFSRRIIKTSQDEIGELAVTLNKMAQDIEDKIREITAQNQKLSAIFNSMVEGVIVVDKAGYVVSINHTIEKIFAVSNAEAKAKLFIEAVRNNDIAEIIKTVLKTGKILSSEIKPVLPVRKIFQINATPIFEDEKVSGCLAVIHDISEIRRLETVQSDFIANVSHELKTPLTSIKGFVETLLDGAIEDKGHNRDFLRIIRDHAERLNALVEDLLSLSHLESKEITLEKKEINLKQHVEYIIKGFDSLLRGKNITVKNELPEGLRVNADKNRIEQVFTNLIDNAVKFNQEKGIVRVYSRDEDDKIRIIVEDSGMGIPEKDLPRIFERFYRVDKARSRELGGTGLGLSIVKHIVELHGGSIGVESIEGFGSKFWFTLPVL